MRETLSKLLAEATSKYPDLFILTGDHGYSLFDAVRKTSPSKFINVGVSEQAMVGYASGLHKVGIRTIIYGLASFVPIRVLEQIKLDLCAGSVPAIIIGDGAGVVYSTLGSSHQCAEDIACLRAMPNISIYSPCDKFELTTCFEEALKLNHTSYIRIGKSDRPEVHPHKPATPGVNRVSTGNKEKYAIVATGSMVSVGKNIGQKYDVSVYSVSKLKPFPDADILKNHTNLFSLEEHSQFGGLFSALSEIIATDTSWNAKVTPFCLEDHFARKCGDYQFALSEHSISDQQLEERLRATILQLESDV